MRIVEIDPLTESFDTDSVFEEKPAVKKKMSLDPREAFGRTAKIFAPAGVGLLFIWFGLTSTGSYFISATRFGGFLAGLFYGWQFGNLLAMVGIVLIYDAIKRSGYL
jgi:hypothetical protein